MTPRPLLVVVCVLAIAALVCVVILATRSRSPSPGASIQLAITQARGLEQVIIAHYETDLHSYPAAFDLRDLVEHNHCSPEVIIDPWGTPFQAVVHSAGTLDNDGVEVISAGPDRRFDTSDDLTTGYD